MSIQHISDHKELAQVLKSNKITVIDFYAEWCPPCKMLEPIFKKVASHEEHSDVNFIKVDIDKAQELKEKYNISSIPTLVYVKKDGTIFKSVPGLVKGEQISNLIKELKN